MRFTFLALVMWKVSPDHAEAGDLEFSMCSRGDSGMALIFATNKSPKTPPRFLAWLVVSA